MLLVVDARDGLLPDDEAIAQRLRRDGKQVHLVVNKVEDRNQDTTEFSRLGWGEGSLISAEHGQGVGDLLDAALEGLPRVEASPEAKPPVSVALVGRPNGGKSSLLNRLVGSERAVVSPCLARRATRSTSSSSAGAAAIGWWTPRGSGACACSRRTSIT